MRSLGIAVLLASLAGLCGCDRRGVAFATARLQDRDGREVGDAVFIQNSWESGVRISIRVWGLPPGIHAVHLRDLIHSRPGSAMPAGGHFNPYGRDHGLQNARGPHAGDLTDLVVSGDGTAETTLWAPLVSLGRGRNSLLRSALEPGGTCLAIESAADDQRSNPDGASGAMMACGIVRAFDGRALEEAGR